jgi:mono/diheme cytochrome c family protein
MATVPAGGSLLTTTTYTSDFTAVVIPAGNVVRLAVMFKQTDGSLLAAPASALNVAWSGPPVVVSTDGSADAGDPIPVAGATPTAFWLANDPSIPSSLYHYTAAELSGVLFITDPGTSPGGTVPVAAAVSGGVTANLTASLVIGPVPAGDATRGATVFSAQCAGCHGPTGDGIDGGAVGINAAAGNVASDPTWNAGLVGSVVRGDIDNQGVLLDPAMPKWLDLALTSQDFIDAYTWLQTQPQ